MADGPTKEQNSSPSTFAEDVNSFRDARINLAQLVDKRSTCLRIKKVDRVKACRFQRCDNSAGRRAGQAKKLGAAIFERFQSADMDQTLCAPTCKRYEYPMRGHCHQISLSSSKSGDLPPELVNP